MDTSVEDLVSHLDDGDLSELRRRYQAGGLAFLQPTLGEPTYRELGARLDGNDRHGVWALLIDKGVVAAPAWWSQADERRRRRCRGLDRSPPAGDRPRLDRCCCWADAETTTKPSTPSVT